MRRIAAHYALMPDGHLLENPLITLDDEGTVTAIATIPPSQLDSSPGVEFHAGILTPAFVNAHSHLELSYLRGAIAEGCGYAGFAGAMAAVRDRYTAEERLRAAAEADREMYEGGIGLVGDISNDDSSFGVKAASPIRYRTFGEVFGLRTDNFDRISTLGRSLLRSGGDFHLTPHSLYSLNDGLLKRICREGEDVLSIHFMESPAEQQLFEGRGPLSDWYRTTGFECDFLHYGSPAERLVSCVPAERSVMLVHCCCVTQRDIDLIMSHFRAPVYWCLCPRSNAYISGLQPPAGLLRRNGLNICTGTDSLASNRSLSLIGELKAMADVPADELLRWATAGGADALGAAEAGRIGIGRKCGLVAVSGVDFGRMRLTDNTRARRVA